MTTMQLKNNRNYKKILFIGGHSNSAIATIDWLLSHTGLEKKNIVWAGHKYWSKRKTISSVFSFNNKLDQKGLHSEYVAIKNRQIDFYTILAGKIFRFRHIKYIPFFLFNLLLIPSGFFHSLYILFKVKPSLIVSFGGYSALPLVIVGNLLNIKSITHEQTIVIGLANRIIARYVEKVYTAWPLDNYNLLDTCDYKYIGLPLNPYLVKKDSNAKDVNHNDKPNLFFTGGKAGSKRFNEYLINNIVELSKTYNIKAVAGSKVDDLKMLEEIISKNNLENVEVYSFLYQEDNAKALLNADIVISRAGAHIIYELIYLNKKALILPLIVTSGNEQSLNAKIAEKRITSIVIRKNKLADQEITDAINKLLMIEKSDTVEEKIIGNSSELLSKEILTHLD